MLNAIKLDRDYRELMSMLVCDRDSKECMVHRCPNCPESSVLPDYLLEQLLQEEEDDDENADEIRFQQWTTVDRSELLQQALPVTQFIEVLVDKMNDLTAHSYIARAQAHYLKQCKEELAADSIIKLGDFAENFKFIIQDEVQCNHWNQGHALFTQLLSISRKMAYLKAVLSVSFLMILTMTRLLSIRLWV